MRRSALSMLAFLLIVLILSLSVSASSSEKVILVTGEWAPFTSESMVGKGLVTEIVAAIFQQMGIEYEIRFYPWARCEAMLENGTAWGAFPYSATPERQQKFAFSEGILKSASPLFYLKNGLGDFQYQSPNDLGGYKVAGIQGYITTEILQSAGIPTIDVANAEAGFHMLMAGRIDFVPEQQVVGWELLKSLYPDRLAEVTTTEMALVESDLNVMVSRQYANSSELLSKFDEAFAAIVDSGEYARILARYNM